MPRPFRGICVRMCSQRFRNIGISLPGTFEEPKAPVYVDGKLKVTLKGDSIVADFLKILEEYVETRYGAGAATAATAR